MLSTCVHMTSPLNLPARAGVSPYTSAFALAETCVFGKQLPGTILCGSHLYDLPLSRSYGVILPSSLTIVLSLTLGFSPRPPVLVCGTGDSIISLEAFLGSLASSIFCSRRNIRHHVSALWCRGFAYAPAFALKPESINRH